VQMNEILRTTVGPDLSRPPPIMNFKNLSGVYLRSSYPSYFVKSHYRPVAECSAIRIIWFISIIAATADLSASLALLLAG
jgi:hypothetical protein